MSTSTDTAVAAPARHAVVSSPIGELTIVRGDGGLTGLYFPGHWTRPDRSRFGPRVDPAIQPGFGAVVTQLTEYFAGQRHGFDLPLNPQGDDRARQLWQLLTGIPYGQTTTYGTLARQAGHGISPQETGELVGRNPLSILIPCHRVVGSTGKLTGYAGGLPRKQWLLELERAIPARTAPLW
jgi:methylated-DNA-[protein]-cysteine S-methyltransferase